MTLFGSTHWLPSAYFISLNVLLVLFSLFICEVNTYNKAAGLFLGLFLGLGCLNLIK